jgi:hypothetical protein
MFLRLVFFSALIMCFFNTKAQKAFHFGGMANFSNPWILNQNNFGTLDGFNNTFARRSELDYSITIGGGFGIVGGYNITKRHGIEFSLFYDKCGQKYHGNIYQETNMSTNFPVEVKRNVKLNYIKLPILYKFELVPKRRSMTKKVNYFFEIGPQVAYLISVYEEVSIDYPGIGNNLAGVPESDKFRKIDIGMAINNGIQYRLNKNVYLNTSLNLYFGLIDINGKVTRDLDYFSNNDVKYRPSHSFNAAVNVGVHYLFIARGYY